MSTWNLSAGPNRQAGAQSVLAPLDEAWGAPEEQQLSLWDLVAELACLLRLGATTTTRCWLVSVQFVERGEEVTKPAAEPCPLLPSGLPVLAARSCRLLTDSGVWVVEVAEQPPCAVVAVEKPRWDADARELWWGERLIKQLRHDAANQECLLAAFQEQDWANRIADPLPKEAGLNRKKRLRETVKSLNQGHRLAVLCFHADGTGQGVRWERVTSAALDKTPNAPPSAR
jgi:hypothetical protein